MNRSQLTNLVTVLVIFTAWPASARSKFEIPPTPQNLGTFITKITEFSDRKQTDKFEDLRGLDESWLCEGFDPGIGEEKEFSTTSPAHVEIVGNEIVFTFLNNEQSFHFKAASEAFVDEQTIRDIQNQFPKLNLEGHVELKTEKATHRFWVDFQINHSVNGIRSGLIYECRENPEF